MSTANKLTYLNTTKQNLKTVINTTGAGLTDESTFRSYANVLNDKILGAINGDVDLFEEYPKVSGNGTDLSLNGVVEGKMAITPQGVSKQGSTTGKNLFNNTTAYIYSPYLTVTKIDGCTYSITGTTDASREIRIVNGYNNKIPLVILPNGTYKTISYFNNELIASTTSVANGSTYHSSGSSYTIDDDFTGISSIAYRIPAGNYNNAILKIMVVDSNTTDLLYEPYTGGISAPNPSYPYPVNNVTGENSLVLQNENLCGKKTINSNIGSAGNINLSANAQFLGINAPIKINPSTTYTLKFINYENTSASLFVGEFDINGTFLRRNALSSARTFTTSSDAYSIFFYLYSNASPFTTINTDIMLVKGSTAPTTYVEHEEQNYRLSFGNMEFNSSPDETIHDQIVGKPNEWYKREYIGKVVLDGSEGYGKNDSTTGYISFTISNFISKIDKTVSNNLYSNMLKAIASGNVANTCRIATTGRIVVTFNSDFCDYDTSALRTKLQTMYSDNNPLILYIPLVEYTDIPITDTTLINQLNDIYNNAHSYNGVTNITATYEDGNEQMYLDIEALKNVWEVTE